MSSLMVLQHNFLSSNNTCKVRIFSEVVPLLKMFTFMSIQTTFINCSIRALITGEGFNSGVLTFMFLQTFFTNCSVRALLTSEGFNSGVCKFMICAFKLLLSAVVYEH